MQHTAQVHSLGWMRDLNVTGGVQHGVYGFGVIALFVWLISHQTAVFFSQNKPATSNQPAVLFFQSKPVPVMRQPNRLISQTASDGRRRFAA
jgi:hypothetical protein